MPQLPATQVITLSTAQPRVTNIGKQLMVSVSVVRSDAADLVHLLILEATLDGNMPTTRALPVFIHASSNGTPGPLAATFPAEGLVPGSAHTVRFKGTTKAGSVTRSFQVEARFTIPNPITPAMTFLQTVVEVKVNEGAGLWSYTLRNIEPSGSTLSVWSFNLPVGAPFVVKATPKGWRADTDNLKYVLWVAENKDDATYNVPPGGVLSGFEIQSASTTSEGTAYSVNSWNSATHKMGPYSLGSVHVPAASH